MPSLSNDANPEDEPGRSVPVHIQPGAEGHPEEDEPAIPDELAVLPLRNAVAFPLSFMPLGVAQPRSRRLVDAATVGERVIALLASKDPEKDEPGPDDVYQVGTAVYLHRMVRSSEGNVAIFVQGLKRIRILSWTDTEPYLKARVEVLPDERPEPGVELEALEKSARELFSRMVNLVPYLPDELLGAAEHIEDPRALSYFIASNLRIDSPLAQEILEMPDAADRLRSLIGFLSRELEVLEIGRRIQQEARGEMDKVQREYYLRQQLKAIQKELGERDESQAYATEIEARLEALQLPKEAREEAFRELGRLKALPEASAEYGVIRGYLDWIASLPWNTYSDDNLDIAHARSVLDADHFGLKDVKSRILEYLAVQKLRRERVEGEGSELSGAILALFGPPGVGKTSLGRSVARALGRQFVRMSLGGLHDEAEIRGHRRTYIGAMPGRIIQGLKRAGTRNPVFMLDEIDKLGSSFRGDPESALLEVLDPHQNREFRDLYLDMPFNLSEVLFICTGNVLAQVAGPLRDRMEVIELSGYTETEKVAIAKGYLVPRQLTENGLRPGELTLEDAALSEIIRRYTREAGVRGLERQIGKVARKAAVLVAGGEKEAITVSAVQVPTHLGQPRFFDEVAERTAVPGVATGLAYTAVGGDVLFVEASAAAGGRGFLVTGQLGDVMRESAQAALSYVRSRAEDLGIEPGWFAGHDLHLHVPAGATPKDGPSAGVTMATALLSLISGRSVRPDVGMTGEITLRGRVLPIGGVKEKVLAAHRAGLRTIILPARNLADLDEVPLEVREAMHFVGVERIDEVWAEALVGGIPRPGLASVELPQDQAVE
ncbi:MAG: endopeptidase La [Ardenticatenia bacterium]|nr:endopeptidase La [Ardenticatenia bacterium]